ncbi:MAG: tetratricopeptide repeat protein [Planctomycetes bacterium]|nr:tetratricopeptide repeat protein [Planctomycetota bacterium]
MMRRARRQAVPIAVMMAAGLVGAGWWLTARQERRDHQRLLEEHLTRAASAAGKGAWDEEIELLDVALKVDPDSREVRRRIAEAQERLAQRRREEERRAKVKEALEIVRRRFSLHQFDDETLAAVERALELDPENSDARHYRGRIRLAHREFEPALEDLRAALAVQPKLACALADSGEVFRLQGKWDEARGFFEQALALDGKLVEAHHGMGHVLDAEGDLEGAEKAYTTALELQKSHSYYADRAEVRARLFCRGGHGDAKLLAEAFSDSETSLGLEKSAAGYHARGKCSLERKDYAKAIADFEEALRLAPQDDRARADLEFARKKAAEPQ